MVDPAGGIAVHFTVNHMLLVNGKVESVVRVGRVMRVAAQGFWPGDDFTFVLDQSLAFGNIYLCKHAFAMHARATNSDSFCCHFCIFLMSLKDFLNLAKKFGMFNTYGCAHVRVRARC
jgi:hypothetical protein